MNVNRKLDRFKQWAGERMGGEVKTVVSDDFKSLEQEMTHRHDGMERLQKAMTSYVKSISKTKEADEKDKSLPISYLGTVMVNHGEQFDDSSLFGNCLIGMGKAQESIARAQERYIARATSSWLESLERSLAQMKEYSAARKKLEARRLAFDASLSKMQKAKKEDFRVEEELRAQKAKYEESNEDVFRRMQDIQESEADSVQDLGAFLDAELDYHERCREILLKLKREWPAAQATSGPDLSRGQPSYTKASRTYGIPYEEAASSSAAQAPQARPCIRSSRTHPLPSSSESNVPLAMSQALRPVRPPAEDSGRYSRERTPAGPGRITRVPTDPTSSLATPLAQLRVAPDRRNWADAPDDSPYSASSPERSGDDFAADSPTTSHGTPPPELAMASRGYTNAGAPSGKKVPPPPPPSRAKKPPPPPPPAKRSTMNSACVSYA